MESKLVAFVFFLSILFLTATNSVVVLAVSIENARSDARSSVAVLAAADGAARAGYVGEFEIIDDHRGGKVVVELIGRINKCGVISPRFDLTLGSIEQWTSNLLPSRQFGFVVMTTSLGIMDHEEVSQFSLFTSFLFLSVFAAPFDLFTFWGVCVQHHVTSNELTVFLLPQARRKSTGGKILGFFY